MFTVVGCRVVGGLSRTGHALHSVPGGLRMAAASAATHREWRRPGFCFDPIARITETPISPPLQSRTPFCSLFAAQPDIHPPIFSLQAARALLVSIRIQRHFFDQ